MSGVWSDLRHGIRILFAKPTASLIAILTLALGIGAATAVFSVVDAVLLRPLPYPEANRLAFLWSTFKVNGDARAGSALPDYREWRDRNHSFSGLGGYYHNDMSLAAGTGQPEQIQAARVTPSLFPVLGVAPRIGRGFAPEEEQFGKHRVAILSDRLWRRRFGGDPNIVGTQILLGGFSHAVVGVMPPMPFFDDLPPMDVFLPISFPPGDNMDSRNNHYVTLVGRLLPGVTPRDAQADADAIARQIEEQLPQKVGFGAQVVSVTEQLTEDVRPALLILFGAVGLLLLVGCVNVANLLLARAVGRQREMAVRASLGATGARLFRQALIESVVLAALAGVAGVVFAWWGLEAMASLLPSNLPRHNAIGVDARVLLFALGASALTVILFGVLPALQVGRGDVQDRLKQAGARTTDGRGRRRLRSLLVAGETALALMLLVGAALLGRSFVRLHGVDPGFSADAIAMRIQLPPAKYAEATRGVAFFDQLVERLRALPGVKAVGAASGLPLGFGAGWGKFLSVEDGPPPRSVADIPLVDFAIAGSDYFRAAGIAVRGGRAFAETDGAKSLQVAVVNEAAARRFYGNGDAVGRWIRMCPPPSLMPEATCPRRQIVGVVADTKREGLNLPTKPQAWIPYRQFDQEGWLSELTLVLRVEGSPTSILPAAREQVRALDPDQPIGEIVTGAELRARSLSLSRFSLLLFGGFAVLAGLLATFGIYGVISYLTAQRTQEIGVRLALGARPRDVVMLVLRQAMGMVVLGVAVGIGAAFALGHVLRSLLFGVGPSDLFSYVVVAAPLMGVALLACWAPARRAARLDPIRSLRAE